MEFPNRLGTLAVYPLAKYANNPRVDDDEPSAGEPNVLTDFYLGKARAYPVEV
jgi:hypothetical protein